MCGVEFLSTYYSELSTIICNKNLHNGYFTRKKNCLPVINNFSYDHIAKCLIS